MLQGEFRSSFPVKSAGSFKGLRVWTLDENSQCFHFYVLNKASYPAPHNTAQLYEVIKSLVGHLFTFALLSHLVVLLLAVTSSLYPWCSGAAIWPLLLSDEIRGPVSAAVEPVLYSL